MIKYFAGTLAASVLALCLSTGATAQQASGSSGTTCTQSGTVVTCVTSTTFNIPTGVNLQAGTGLSQFTLAGSAVVGPVCSGGLNASPPSVSVNTPMTINLSVVGCPVTGVNYTWNSPVTQVNNPSTSHVLTLSSGTQPYSVLVCFDANTLACTPYATSVGLSGGTPALGGCSATASPSSVVTGSTPTVSVTCTSGTGQASYGVTYQWSKNGNAIPGATGQSYTLTTADTASAGTLTMSVLVSNNAPTSLSPSTTVTVTSSGGTGTNFCPNQQQPNAQINASETYKKIYSTNLVGSTTHWVVRVPVTDDDTTVGAIAARISWAEAPSNTRAFRKISISKNLCDYTSSASTYLITSASNTGSASLAVNDTTKSLGTPNLTTGTWYVNMTNVSCAANTTCNALLEWVSP